MAGAILHIRAEWQDNVWVVTSEDVPGLVTYAATEQELADKLKHLVPACFANSQQTVPNNYQLKITYVGGP